METLKKIIALITEVERRKGLVILFLVIIMALLETLSVASIMPFLAVLETKIWCTVMTI